MSHTPPVDGGRGTNLGLTINTYGGTPTTPNPLHASGGNIDVGPRFSFTHSKSAMQMTEDSVKPSAQPTVIYLGGERDSFTTQGSEEDTPPPEPDHLATSTIAPSIPAPGPVQRRPTTGGSPIAAETIISTGSSSPNRGSPTQHSPVRSPVEPPSPPSLDKDDSWLCTKFFKAVCECCCGSKKK